MPRNGRGCTPRATGADVRPRPLPNLTSFQDAHGQGFCNTALNAMIRRTYSGDERQGRAMDDEQKRIERNLAKLASRTLEQEAELVRIEREAIARFHGMFDDLEAALGVLRMGHHLGWRVLVLIHNKRTIRNTKKSSVSTSANSSRQKVQAVSAPSVTGWPRNLAISGKPLVAPSRSRIAGLFRTRCQKRLDVPLFTL